VEKIQSNLSIKHIKITLEKIGGLKNGQSRDTGTPGTQDTREEKNHNEAQKAKEV
jgi:hypothetical protein